MGYARQLFDEIPSPDIVLWNAMFKGYVQNELYVQVVALFNRMKSVDERPNCFTFPMVFKSCAKLRDLQEGERVHCVVVKIGFKSNPFIGTTLIDVYSSGGAIRCAHKVFGEMTVRNIVAWTSMINGYISSRDLVSARSLFDLAPERDIVLWNTMVSGYIERRDMVAARKLFDVMPNRDLMSWNTLLNGYGNNADVEGCEKLFKEMPERNIFSWNGLIGGYARNGRFFEVLRTFKRMLRESDVCPNDATLVTVLSACARLGALDMGKWVHVYAESNGYKENIFVSNALIDMYAKCGSIDDSIDVFNSLSTKDLISWNTIINGLAVHGRGADALSLFSQMKDSTENPDGITFIGVLCACSHMGLVEDGYSYFHSMTDEYSIMPQIEHYGCMVDLLARAGRLDQAVDFVRKMPMEADGIIWTALLGACRGYKNIRMAELALQRLIELEPRNPASYVMLSNIYGDARRWKDVSRLKVAMRNTGFKKLPGCSLIEVDEGVAEFYSSDEKHPKTEEIYAALRGLTKLLRLCGYVPDLLELGYGTQRKKEIYP
ncbi:pentatricopeptide repeat-containing protein At1g08070, chloroplastic-like [Actinidia eriantha]|uniref:pentatricopeptide repeat-containing protein At1g08070, chloroplastic-like n=1 Tax=Actinidia eriantha TaxID=165200 RepID=UPI00258B442F|nr:pentatricopeptide repeat-containing protein At1g08070, chloroplastic-like [Actinidia eriantha]